MAIDRAASLKKAEQFIRQGRLDGAIGEYVRLVEDHPLDWNTVNALGDLYVCVGAADRAVTQFLRVADQLLGEGSLPRAAALYKKALKVGGHHDHALLRLGEIAGRQGLLTDAQAYLGRLAEQRRLRGDQSGAAECLARLDALHEPDAASPVTSPSVTRPQGEDPDVLVALGQMELDSEESERAHTVFARLLAIAPDRHADVTRMALEQARKGRLESAFACIGIVVDASLLEGHWERAVAALQTLVQQAPHIPALIKLVELCVDAGLDAALRDAQARLADAYLDAGQGVEARFIAQDLLDRDPATEAHARRLRHALELLGMPDSNPAGTARLAAATAPAGVPDAVQTGDVLEVDLSQVLADLGAAPQVSSAGAVVEPPALESAFAEIPPPVSRRSAADAAALYDRGLGYVRAGRTDEAIADLREAARTPSLRFQAAAELGRFHLTRGESQAGVDWMECASESPAPTPEERRALLYELAMVLEQLGETARALAVLLELHAGAGSYLDVESRIERLRRTQGGHGG